jgi:hypothetical protein
MVIFEEGPLNNGPDCHSRKAWGVVADWSGWTHPGMASGFAVTTEPGSRHCGKVVHGWKYVADNLPGPLYPRSYFNFMVNSASNREALGDYKSEYNWKQCVRMENEKLGNPDYFGITPSQLFCMYDELVKGGPDYYKTLGDEYWGKKMASPRPSATFEEYMKECIQFGDPSVKCKNSDGTDIPIVMQDGSVKHLEGSGAYFLMTKKQIGHMATLDLFGSGGVGYGAHRFYASPTMDIQNITTYLQGNPSVSSKPVGLFGDPTCNTLGDVSDKNTRRVDHRFYSYTSPKMPVTQN